ncbi:hypothetical protein GCM10010420_44880 [Streptomyces glaucosporus]|uniref:Uncharacterized protein n=1 Tax=Streptomyces glaucosporus TaxID=284044 RepID=A0ABP5VT25_9ACTN
MREETSAISRLWSEGRLPVRDGAYDATGRAWDVVVDPAAPGGLLIADEFSLDAFLDARPDWVTAVDPTVEEQVGRGGGFLCCGEGSYGSEGFIARLDPRRKLLWAVYLEDSDPFVSIDLRNDTARFRSSSGVTVTVDAGARFFRPAGDA